MIRVDLTMWRFGDKNDAYPLGAVEIANDGTGTDAIGHYNVTVYKKNGAILGHARVENFPRKRFTATELLARALSAAGYNHQVDRE